jgi:hypothetical protein
MEILAIYYGDFPEIERLYERFAEGRNKLKVVVDVTDQIPDRREKFVELYQFASRWFPTLREHSCCEDLAATPLALTEEKDVSIRRVDEIADFPHLLEHLIVDLQCTLAGMGVCSGITCGWKNPEHRFDLFVECDDPRIGVFAACFGTHLINNFLAGRPGEDDYGLMLQVAGLVESFPETKEAIRRLAAALNESVENITRAVNMLAQFNFFLEIKDQDDQN